MHNELFGYDKRTFNETPTPVTSKSRIIVQNNSRKSIILRRRREYVLNFCVNFNQIITN